MEGTSSSNNGNSLAWKKLHKLLVTAKEGTPCDESALQQAPLLVRQCAAGELAALASPPPAPARLPPAPAPGAPLAAVADALGAVAALIARIGYNHTGRASYFSTSKKRPFSAICDTARAIVAEPMPIKCVEATFLAMYATAGWPRVRRVPLAFKTRGADGQVYRHVVLAVHVAAAPGQGSQPDSGSQAAAMQQQQQRPAAACAWGALGASRRAELASKALAHASLAALVESYAAGYARWGHALLKVRAGLPAPHDPRAAAPVAWRYACADVAKRGLAGAAAVLDAHAAHLDALAAQYDAAAASGHHHHRRRSASAVTPPRSPSPLTMMPGENAEVGATSDDFETDSDKSADSVVVALRSPRPR